ncbi:MAG: hypothetical protein AUK47_21340 [Deltaproteobacteria bacterium CG2_30_63_29]|nr:MAG: hypothetical protein AUK47_21340 [Deltaproteobacteria bacterium CG2_30_63_29]PJB49019.1 MAG: hypothetical protein CO108_01190 [Deltaproteobacteria bacterium CG_4_9_14_3_um_filter_63_12]
MEPAQDTYCEEVSAAFLNGRGHGLVMSSKDLSIVWAWREAKIPLSVVLRGLEHAFAVWQGPSAPRSISFAREHVERLFCAHREQHPSPRPPSHRSSSIDLERRRQLLIELGQRSSEERTKEALRSGYRALVGADNPADSWKAARKRILEALRAGLRPDEHARIERDARRGTEVMAPDAAMAHRARQQERCLLELFGLDELQD